MGSVVCSVGKEKGMKVIVRAIFFPAIGFAEIGPSAGNSAFSLHSSLRSSLAFGTAPFVTSFAEKRKCRANPLRGPGAVVNRDR